MNILLVSPKTIPAIEENRNQIASPVGGWITSLSENILNQTSHNLGILFPEKRDAIETGNCGRLTYWAVPSNYSFGKYTEKQKFDIKEIIMTFMPDVVVVFGTEQYFQCSVVDIMIEYGLSKKIAIWIQGLVSIYAEHYMTGLPWYVQIIPSLRDVYQKDSLVLQKKDFIKRGKAEIEILKKVGNVFGRTCWDYACTRQINSDVKYYHVNETMRDSFFDLEWKYCNCIPHKIYIAQAQYPIKGFHYALKAVSILKKKYPDIQLVVSGPDNIFKPKWKETAYGRYIRKMIKRDNLVSHIKYLGMLEEKEVVQQMLSANVYVSSSTIENSPNSLCEAMLLGTPVVSSDVGGVKELVNDGISGYVYHSDAAYMLAYYLDKIFEKKETIEPMTLEARREASLRHNKKENLKAFLDACEDIVGR